MTWWVASLVSNACIVMVEYLNRTAPPGDLVAALKNTWPLIAVAQVCLFYSFNGAPHLMIAWLVFALGNSTMRMGMVYTTGQPIGSWPLVLAGVTGMLACSYVLKLGLK